MLAAADALLSSGWTERSWSLAREWPSTMELVRTTQPGQSVQYTTTE